MRIKQFQIPLWNFKREQHNSLHASAWYPIAPTRTALPASSDSEFTAALQSFTRRMRRLRPLCLCTVTLPSARSISGPPVASSQAELLRAVISKLPPGALVTADQLRSLMGIHSRDLCGVPLKEVGGSWNLALQDVLGKPESRERDGRRGSGRSNSGGKLISYIVPAESAVQWTDPRPPPELSTRCLGEVVEGSVTWLTNDPAACDELVQQCGFETASHVGLDTEWTPTMVRGQRTEIAMLQLATRERCLLVRVGQMPRPLPPRLCALLGASSPLKVGRGIRQDAKLIRAQLGAVLAGVKELPGRESLKALACTVGGLRLPGDGKWMTNWDARELDTMSLQYAAFDSIAAFAVHAKSNQTMQGTGQIARTRSRRSEMRAALKELGAGAEEEQDEEAEAQSGEESLRAAARL